MKPDCIPIQEEEKSTIDTLNDLHHDLVGEAINITDLDKVVNILEVLAETVEKLDGHSHSIS